MGDGMGIQMSAFAGLRIPSTLVFSYSENYEETPGESIYPGNYNSENSNTPFAYPWGKKHRNMFFIGPHKREDQGLEIHP